MTKSYNQLLNPNGPVEVDRVVLAYAGLVIIVFTDSIPPLFLSPDFFIFKKSGIGSQNPRSLEIWSGSNVYQIDVTNEDLVIQYGTITNLTGELSYTVFPLDGGAWDNGEIVLSQDTDLTAYQVAVGSGLSSLFKKEDEELVSSPGFIFSSKIVQIPKELTVRPRTFLVMIAPWLPKQVTIKADALATVDLPLSPATLIDPVSGEVFPFILYPSIVFPAALTNVFGVGTIDGGSAPLCSINGNALRAGIIAVAGPGSVGRVFCIELLTNLSVKTQFERGLCSGLLSAAASVFLESISGATLITNTPLPLYAGSFLLSSSSMLAANGLGVSDDGAESDPVFIPIRIRMNVAILALVFTQPNIELGMHFESGCVATVNPTQANQILELNSGSEAQVLVLTTTGS